MGAKVSEAECHSQGLRPPDLDRGACVEADSGYYFLAGNLGWIRAVVRSGGYLLRCAEGQFLPKGWKRSCGEMRFGFVLVA